MPRTLADLLNDDTPTPSAPPGISAANAPVGLAAIRSTTADGDMGTHGLVIGMPVTPSANDQANTGAPPNRND